MRCSAEELRGLVDRDHKEIAVYRQCELLGLPRSTYYYEPLGESRENEELMRLLDRQYVRTPFYGARRMREALRRQGWAVNVKRVRRLMRLMGLEAVYPRKRTTVGEVGYEKHPYLLRGLTIDRPDQVWATDIAYIPLRRGFLYLVVMLDWRSRYILSWRLSNTLDASFCVEALEEALSRGCPEIFNSDQGSQFTSCAFQAPLKAAGVRISMDGRGRAYDNIFVERFWRSLKYEEVYLREYEGGWAAAEGIGRYIRFYNEERVHQALGYRTPAEVYRGEG